MNCVRFSPRDEFHSREKRGCEPPGKSGGPYVNCYRGCRMMRIVRRWGGSLWGWILALVPISDMNPGGSEASSANVRSHVKTARSMHPKG